MCVLSMLPIASPISALPRLLNGSSPHNPSCPVAAALYESLHADVRRRSQSELSLEVATMWPARHGHHFAVLSQDGRSSCTSVLRDSSAARPRVYSLSI